MDLITKDRITSLELLEQINLFRKQEGKKKDLRHDTLRDIIKDEFEEEILFQKILEKSISSNGGRPIKSFELTLNQAKQVLMRESKFVRRAVIHYIERLENALKSNKSQKEQLLLELEKPLERLGSIFNINLQSIGYENLSNFKQSIDKYLECEKDKEKELIKASIEAYHIFNLNNEKEIETEKFIEKLNLYIQHLRMMNLFNEKIEEIVRIDKKYPL
jgi:hypothetical protein